MIVEISEVANRFGVSKRSVQLWCKADGIKKIGNEYQITREVVDRWLLKKAQNETKNQTKQISVRKAEKIQFTNHQFVLMGLTIFVIVALLFYIQYSNSEMDKKDTIITNKNTTINQLQKSNRQLQKTTIKKDNEIQSLKKKIVIDSMLMNQPRFYKRSFKP